jgi:hypothetical protein
MKLAVGVRQCGGHKDFALFGWRGWSGAVGGH